MLSFVPRPHAEYMKNYYSQADQSRNGGWLSLVSKEYFQSGMLLLEKIRYSVQQNHWGRHGNGLILIAAKTISKNAEIRKAFFDSCGGSEVAASSLQSLMDQMVLKVFHAHVGASMKAWKVQNTSRAAKGLLDEAFRTDLKSKVSKTTKEVGEFAIKKRGARVLTETIGDAKKGKSVPKPRDDEEEGRKE